MVFVDATFQSSDRCHEQPGAWPVLPSVPASEQSRAGGFPPHSDDIQLSHSFLDSGGNPCGLGFGGAWMSKVQIFSHCPVALNCNLSFNFPLCIKHICASRGQMYSI